MSNPYEVPEIITERLVLRKWAASDAEDMFEYASDPEVARFALWPRHETIDDTRQDLMEAQIRYDKKDWIYWGIVERSTNKFMGSIGFPIWRQRDRNAEIGFALHRAYWKQGIMTEALTRIVQFGWEEMGLHRLEAKCVKENSASCALLTKMGFKLEGVRKEATIVDEQFADILMWGLIRK